MINIYKLKLTNLQQEIMRLLYIKTGKPLNAHRIATILRVSQPAVSKALPQLGKMDFIKIEKDNESKRFSIELNTDNPIVIGLKRADNLKQLYESELITFLYDNFPGTTVILFGSYAFGEDTVTSDIDLAIIGGKEKQIDLTKFENILGREIIINYYSFFKDINKNLLSNVLNGITLKGAVEIWVWKNSRPT